MDPIATYLLLSSQEEEEEAAAIAILGTILAGSLEARIQRSERRRDRRLYLRRAELLPSPRENTPWQALWNSQDDRAFITTMGFDVNTFHYILKAPGGFEELWNASPIPREDNEGISGPCVDRRSLDAAGALGLVLHYLGSAMLEVSLQQIFALTPATASRYLNFGQDILHQVLQHLPEARIEMPANEDEFCALSDVVAARHPLLDGAFATIDGLSLPVQVSDDPEIENATYNGWKSDHRINNVLVFSPEGVIIMAVFNAPGSFHDSRVARPIFDVLRTHVPEGYFLVADSGFPRGSAAIRSKIHTPLKSGDTIPGNPVAASYLLDFNRELLSYRQTAEWGMRMLQGSFGRLRVPLDIKFPQKRARLLSTCFRLSNLRVRCVGIGQIQQVYMRAWDADDKYRFWDNLGNTIFGDVRRRDRVSRFHLVVEDQ